MGIGCISGPVVAAAVVVPARCPMIAGVRDSKRLTRERREELFPRILEQALAVGVGAASVDEIDRLNVLQASHLAMRRALARIGSYDHALIDGRPIKDAEFGPFTAIVRGDASCYAIACAAIVAKVFRDRLMGKLANHFPDYGWDHNVGYGTPRHLAALRQYGLTPYHRRSYAPVHAVAEQRAPADDDSDPRFPEGASADGIG